MEIFSPPRRRSLESKDVAFVTFYSFKGGVGRTLALLNVACILAGLGRRVLMIDFDLEAPGLTLFQDRQLETGRSQEQAGLVDLITDFLADPWTSPVGDGDAEALFDEYVARLTVPEGVQNENLEGGYLNLIPAGCLSPEYEEKMYGLSFDQMFEEGIGKPFFKRLKKLIRDSGRYDYVFVDSRTGFSDEGSISTRFLGDYQVVLTGLNNQNVIGTARFLHHSAIDDQEKLALVASPVPMYYEDLRRERIKEAKKQIGRRAGLNEVRFVTQIPYHPILALEEDPTVRDLHDTDLFEAYKTLTRTVREWAGDLPEEQIQGALKRFMEGDENFRSDILRIAAEDTSLVLTRLRFATSGLEEEDIEKARRVLELGVSVAYDFADLEQNPPILHWAGTWYVNNGYPSDAKEKYKKIAEIEKELDRIPGVGACHENLGTICGMLGAVDQALEHYKKAKECWQRLGEESDELGVDIKISALLIDAGRAEDAANRLDRVVEQFQKLNKKSGVAYGLIKLGLAYAHLDRRKDAEKRIGQANQHFSESENDSAMASFYTDAIEGYAAMDPPQALKQLRTKWAFIEKHGHPFVRNRARVLRARLILNIQEDTKVAAEDAKKAMDFYQEREVDSVWSREAEEIWERTRDDKD